GLGGIECERVAEIEIDGECADQRLIPRVRAAPRSRTRQQEAVEPLALRALAEHVEPIADLQILQLAQKAVELAQGLRLILADGDAAITIDTDGAGALQDLGGERRDT